jgi:hypothetical protein
MRARTDVLFIGLTRPFLTTRQLHQWPYRRYPVPYHSRKLETPLRVQGSQSAGKRLIPPFFTAYH